MEPSHGVPRPLYEALEELRAARDDLQRSSYQTFDGIFARYAAQLKPGTALGDLLEGILPEVSFDPFWDAAKGTMGGMVGSGKLAFPPEKRARVAMQRALLLRMGDGNPDLHEVTYIFFHSGNSLEGGRREFVSQVIEPFHRDAAGLVNPYLQEEKESALSRAMQRKTPSGEVRPFVDPDRIGRFRELDDSVSLDLRKLIRLSEELNLAYGNRAWLSVAFLTRTVLNHVAPALGYATFDQVAAHASPKHYKLAAESLETFARKVADFHLHEPVSEQLALPTETQVNVMQQLDIVLSEVERALAKRAASERQRP
jgi:hypothetical protein